MTLAYEENNNNYRRRAPMFTRSSGLQNGDSENEEHDSDTVSELFGPSPNRSTPRAIKGHKRSRSDYGNNLQPLSMPQSPQTHSVPAFMRSNSSGSMRRPLSFIAGLASKVKSAFEINKDPKNSDKWTFNGTEFDSCNSENSSPNMPRKSINTYPRIRKTNDRLTVPSDRQWPSRRKKVLNPAFAEVMDILSVPSSPELEREAPTYPPLPRNKSTPCVESDRRPSDIIIEQPNDVIKSIDANKSSDVNVLVIGSEGVGKSALVVRYLTKRFIGDYAPNIETVYDHTIVIDGKEIYIHVWDSGIPAMLQKSSEKPEAGVEKSTLDLRETLSMTSLSSSVRSSVSSTASSTYDNRVSTSSFDDEQHQFMTSFGSKVTINLEDDKMDKKSIRKKKKEKKELNNNLNKKENEMQTRLNWCDCIVVVYSICDSDSFDSARDIIRYIRGQYVRGHAVSEFESGVRRNSGSDPVADPVTRLMQIPILLVGNKADLEHRRCVEMNAATEFSLGYGCSAVELSAPEGFESISKVFNGIIENIRRDKLPSKLTKIKSIVRGFGHRRNMSM
ncbi:uncharacterized protein LOC120333760 [Styela clava]